MNVQKLVEHLKLTGRWSPDLKVTLVNKSCGVITESTVDTSATHLNCAGCNHEKVRLLNESLDKPVYAWRVKNNTLTVKTFEE